jgi:arsenite methyltransferase
MNAPTAFDSSRRPTATPVVSVEDMTADELRRAVAHRYGQVAIDPAGSYNFPVGRAFAEAVGYPPDLLDSFPPMASATFAGVAYLAPWTGVTSGAMVIDLGCGAGLDSLIAAHTTGEFGHVHAVDIGDEMVRLARDNVVAAGLANVTLHQAAVEALPLPDDSADIAIANGVFNLSPDKERVAAEARRVLRPDGWLVGAEIVLSEEVPRVERNTLADWFR